MVRIFVNATMYPHHAQQLKKEKETVSIKKKTQSFSHLGGQILPD
jgi:hypothetical protein